MDVSLAVVGHHHRVICQTRIGAAVGSVPVVVRRLPGELGHRAASAKYRAKEVLTKALGNSVGSSHRSAKLHQDEDRKNEPSHINGLEKVCGVPVAMGEFPCLSGGLINFIFNGDEILILVLILNKIAALAGEIF